MGVHGPPKPVLAGDLDAVLAEIDRALRCSAASGDKPLLAELHRLEGEMWERVGDPSSARRRHERTIEIARHDRNVHDYTRRPPARCPSLQRGAHSVPPAACIPWARKGDMDAVPGRTPRNGGVREGQWGNGLWSGLTREVFTSLHQYALVAPGRTATGSRGGRSFIVTRENVHLTAPQRECVP